MNQCSYLYSYFEKKCPSNTFNYKYMDFLSMSLSLSEEREWNSSAVSYLKITSPGKPLSMQELSFQGAQHSPWIIQ